MGLRNGKEGREASSAFLSLDDKRSQRGVLLCTAVVGGVFFFLMFGVKELCRCGKWDAEFLGCPRSRMEGMDGPGQPNEHCP